jgi:hypothetical protein
MVFDDSTKHQDGYSTTERNLQHYNRREHETSGWLQYNREERTTLQQTRARNIRVVTVQQWGTYNTTTVSYIINNDDAL